MINPKDTELLLTEEGRAQLGQEFITEFTCGRGEEEATSKTVIDTDDEEVKE